MKKLILILLLMLSFKAFAQSEFLVNSATDSTQRSPRVAGPDLNGNYVVVWQSFNGSNDIYLQKYDKNNAKVGSEVRVNDITDGEQERPSVAMNKTGSYVVVWSSYTENEASYMYDIKAKVFPASSSPSQEFLVNRTRENTQTSPDVAIDENGNIVVVWESWFQDGSDRGIFAQRLRPDGSYEGNEFQVNTTTAFSQARPSIEFFNDGRFIIAWESWTNNQAYDVYAQCFKSDGTKENGEFRVNTTVADNQWFSSIAVNSDNSFSILWCSWEQDGDDGGIYLQRYMPDCTKKGGEFRVNTTTKFYQWLPRAKYLKDGKLAVVWSSWQTDLNREGVYYSILDTLNNNLTLERKANNYVISFQWEPDLMVKDNGDLMLFWSSWGQINKDYDVFGKNITPDYPTEVVKPSTLSHSEGQSATELIVHVLDRTKLTGHTYQVSFSFLQGKYFDMTVKDLMKGTPAVTNVPLTYGSNIFYMTDEFDGIAVELRPRFNLDLDTATAHVIASSKTNLQFRAGLPKIGKPILAPVDVALVWGKTDTLSGGAYASPLDTALNGSSKKVILIPFKAVNMQNNKKLDVLVMENTATKNNKWDPGETIILLTPPEYRTSTLNTHAQLTSPAGGASNVIMPSEGDTLFLRTLKPLSAQDSYSFSTSTDNITLGLAEAVVKPESFLLEQNYPNPFNPTTTIRFYIPKEGNVELKIFDLLGREVRTMTEGFLRSGIHSFVWNGKNDNGFQVSSGVYIYRLKSGSYMQSKKMVLTK
ncbi:MAG: T9SS type A sorting domain-containing protein [Ignavibacteria bacterium]|jgi:hypothetical protein|nr:T9SS type A sorting domain-containing protein [Ignavibacteria bacterium]MCU7502106.1 T9SS type A sorting domain-containing protein [Ignavibacteria bacterium]MCU7515508.1 T9SS type A sorting domain-containing protein [Ignavibacteria bacterium]